MRKENGGWIQNEKKEKIAINTLDTLQKRSWIIDTEERKRRKIVINTLFVKGNLKNEEKSQ